MGSENKGLPSQEEILESIDAEGEESEGGEAEPEAEENSGEAEGEEEAPEAESEEGEGEESEEAEPEETADEKAQRAKLPPKFLKEVKDLRAERRKLREENAALKGKADEKVKLPETLQTKLTKLTEAVKKEPWVDEFLYQLAEGADEISVEQLEAVIKAKKDGVKPADRALKQKVDALEETQRVQTFREQIAKQTKEVKAAFKNFDEEDISEIKRMAYVKSVEEGKPQESLMVFAKEYEKRLKALKQKLLKPVAAKREVKDGLRVETGGGSNGAEKKKLPTPGSEEFRKLVASGALDKELGLD